MKKQSPFQSIDNVVLDLWHGHRRTARARVSVSKDDLRDQKWATSGDRNFGSDNGVRNWLIGLGLSRYAPVFEIHEVDDEVLPMLTLEDLKDMGVGYKYWWVENVFCNSKAWQGLFLRFCMVVAA